MKRLYKINNRNYFPLFNVMGVRHSGEVLNHIRLIWDKNAYISNDYNCIFLNAFNSYAKKRVVIRNCELLSVGKCRECIFNVSTYNDLVFYNLKRDKVRQMIDRIIKINNYIYGKKIIKS